MKYAQKGSESFLNRSIFDCHNVVSKDKILEYYKRFLNGENEIFLQVTKSNQKVYMAAVRDEAGTLMGYYERFEDIHKE